MCSKDGALLAIVTPICQFQFRTEHQLRK